MRWRRRGCGWLVHDSSTRSRFSSAVIEIIRAGAIFCSAAKRRAINRPPPPPPSFSHSPPSPPPPPSSSSFYSPVAGGGSYALKAAMLHSSRTGNVYLILGRLLTFQSRESRGGSKTYSVNGANRDGWGWIRNQRGAWFQHGFRVYEI